MGGVPSVGGLFYVILARIYASFGENHGKLRTARLTSATGVWTWHIPSSSFQRYHSATGWALRPTETKENKHFLIKYTFLKIKLSKIPFYHILWHFLNWWSLVLNRYPHSFIRPEILTDGQTCKDFSSTDLFRIQICKSCIIFLSNYYWKL